MAVRGHELGLGEAERLEIAAHHLGHFGDAVVLGADRTLPHPALQLCEMLLEVAVDVRVNVLMAAGIRRDVRRLEFLVNGDLELRRPGGLREEVRRQKDRGQEGNGPCMLGHRVLLVLPDGSNPEAVRIVLHKSGSLYIPVRSDSFKP